MADENRFGRDVYLALAAVGWADGRLDQEEADAIVKAALEEGLGLEEIADIEHATKERIDLGDVDTSGLTEADRLYVYGVASWLTQIDEELSDGEKKTLASLADALGVSEEQRADVDITVREVTYLSEDERPLRYDLGALRRILGERLAPSAEG